MGNWTLPKHHPCCMMRIADLITPVVHLSRRSRNRTRMAGGWVWTVLTPARWTLKLSTAYLSTYTITTWSIFTLKGYPWKLLITCEKFWKTIHHQWMIIIIIHRHMRSLLVQIRPTSWMPIIHNHCFKVSWGCQFII